MSASIPQRSIIMATAVKRVAASKAAVGKNTVPGKVAVSRPPAKSKAREASTNALADVSSVLKALEALGTEYTRNGYARYGIVAPKAFGVAVGDIQSVGKRVGRNHELALELWETGWYEARMLCSFIDEPAKVTPAQMDRWCRDFDNWGICDTLCFHLFDRTPHAWSKVRQWCAKKREFEKRAGFALMASIAGHDKKAPDALFLEGLDLIAVAADDERNFVKKAVNWALRRIGGRNDVLNAAAVRLSERLAKSTNATERWVAKDALREFARNAAKRKKL
jgi:3-methyladenine DNA glycosylase AlkD